MLESIHIQNYRLFKDLKIDELGQVNLIAGKNNTGKTALLEAIALSESDLNYTGKLLSSFIKLRGEFLLSYNDIIEVFCDRNYVLEEETFLKFRIPKNGEFEPICELGKKILLFEIDNLEYTFRSNSTNEKDSILNISEHDLTFEVIDRYFSESRSTVIILPFKTDFDISSLWENIDLTPRKKDVIKILQTIDNQIVDVGIDLRNRQPKVLLSGSLEPTPLDRFGDGVNRLFRIALCLVNAKNKTLLIDEFEAGLHYSIQEDLWDIIFQYAKEWKIQVFVTTHSRDTVAAFAQVGKKYGNMANYFRLQRTRNGKDIVPVNYDINELEIAIEQDIETR